MPLRLDYSSGQLGRVERTPQGGLRAPGTLTRSGVFVYTRPDGSVRREYRPPSEVFSPESLATLRDAPVTINHPKIKGQNVRVSPDNYRAFSVGHLTGEARQDGSHIVADLALQDVAALDAIFSRGVRELSCGYDCDTDPTPGRTDEGEEYDVVQRNIRYNHVAIVQSGRAGSARLRLDSADDQLTDIDIEGELMTPEQIAKMLEEVGQLRARISELEKALGAKSGEADAATARADAAEARAKVAEAKVAEALAPARLDSLVSERAEILARAQSVLGADYQPAGKSNRQLRSDALEKAVDGFKADGRSDEYLAAYFDAMIKPPAPAQGSDGLRRSATAAHLGGPRTDSKDEPETAEAARARMLAAHRAAASGALAATK